MTIHITYFVHGTTTDNEKHLSSGWKDVGLSKLGIKQSKELKNLVKGKKFNVVFCSDLKRAVDSTNITFKGQVKIIKDKRLRECNYGKLNGAKSEIVDALTEKSINKSFPNGESYKDVEKRLRSFLEYLSDNYSNKEVAIVSHKGPQLALDVILNGKSWKQAIREDWRLKGHKGWRPGWEYAIEGLSPNEKQNCIIIHGCPSDKEKAMDPKTRTYDKHWIPWVKKELSKRGIKTDTPLMPEPWYPDYSKFRKKFEKYKVTNNTILIGHSCGCAFLVRWLGDSKKRINKLILVAPWKIPAKRNKYKKGFYEYPIDKTIKSRVNEIVMFTADDEEAEGKESLVIFHKTLGGKVIELKKHGHYVIGDMGTEEFPELLREITKTS